MVDDSNTRCCGRKWCVKDCCGIACAVITWMLLAFGEFCVVSIMVAPETDHFWHQTINALVFHAFFLLALTSHIKTMLTDPGAVPRGNATEEYIERLGLKQGQVVYKCSKCASIKPERAHHCSVCQRCIRRMDHHCPWVNNCIGEANQKYFVLFTLYISLVSLHGLYWGIWQFTLCVQTNWNRCTSWSPPSTTLLLIFMLFEAVLFAIFTLVMFGTQISAICYDETGIESLKQEHGDWEKMDRWKCLEMVFGGKFSLAWFNPFVAPVVSKQRPFEYSV